MLQAAGTAARIETAAVDVSMGGALLENRPGLGDGPWALELHLPDDAAPLKCTATLARRTQTQFGIAFADVSDADLLRLDTAITRHQQPHR